MPTERAAPLPARAPPGDRTLLHVLVVDDQDHVRTWIRRILTSAGITIVTEAENGRAALAAVTTPGAWFDLILCDLKMQDGDGIETIRAFAALGLESAIAILSVEPERVVETAGMLAELQGLRMMGTIGKPLTLEKLEPVLARMLEEPSAGAPATLAAPEEEFANAFARSELRMYYQPKVRMHSGEFAGVEALVRWKHPVLGLVAPGSFVPSMEDDAVHGPALMNFTLRESMACAARWTAAGVELRVAVNLSARAFDSLDLPERLQDMARDAGVPTDRITLEVTETHVARDAIKLLDVATRLRLKGFRLAIDDFGTGHSGLSMLQKLPFSELKIDRSFVHGCAASPSQRSVVEASIALARSLKLTSVAEGVQQRPDWDLLAELGCDQMQGYFVARPMGEEGLEAWVAQWSLRDR